MKSKSARQNSRSGMILKLAGALALVAWVGPSAFGAIGFSTNLAANGMIWSYGYEGGVYPTNGFGVGDYWTEDNQNAPSPADGAVTVTSEGLTVDTGVSGNGMGFRLSGGGTTLLVTNVYTVEFRMRLLSGNPNTMVGGLDFRTDTETAGFVVRASQNYVELRGAAGNNVLSNLVLGTDWHTYRVVSAGGISTLYVDDLVNPLISTNSKSGGGSSIEFGDFGGLIGSGSAEYDYVRWANGVVPAPEPSVLLLLTMAAGILHRRKCKRTT